MSGNIHSFIYFNKYKPKSGSETCVRYIKLIKILALARY